MNSRLELRPVPKPYFLSVIKIGIPLLCAASLVVMLQGSTFIQVLPFLPLVWLIALYFTAARIRVCGNALQYRRFIRWKDIPWDEVVDAKWSLIPPLACLKLRRFLPPWGRLYYLVEEANRFNFSLRRTAFMQALVSRAGKDNGETHNTKEGGEGQANDDIPKRFGKGWIFGCVCAAGLGVFIELVYQPSQGLPLTSPNSLPTALRVFVRFVAFLNHPPFLVAFAIGAVVFLIRSKFGGMMSLITSFLIGGIAAHLIRVWVFR